MRKRWVWGLICLLLCLLPACGQEKPAANDVPPASESPVEAAPQKREADFSAAFGGIQGCAVLYDPGTDQWTFYQEELCRQRVSPCSTFKIVSTLMGLHTGVLSGPESTMTYSGLTYPAHPLSVLPPERAAAPSSPVSPVHSRRRTSGPLL